MFRKNIKSHFYRKIFVGTPPDYIRMNCKNDFEFRYSMKDIGICSMVDKYDIGNSFIDVMGIKYENHNKKFIRLKQSDKSSYYTMKSDFSNILEISDKFNALVKLLSESFDLQSLYVSIENGLNYIIRTKDESKDCIFLYVNNNFKNFNILEEYDLEVVSGIYPEFDNKIVFDGEFIKTRNYIIRLMKKVNIDEFEIEIDKKINDVRLEYSYDMNGKIFITKYKQQVDKYDILFNPKKLEHFLYLKILNNSSWCKNGSDVYYSEDEVLSRLYDI